MSFLDLRLEEPETFNDDSRRLHSVIQNYLQPEKKTTLQQTAQSILAILPKKDPVGTDVWNFGEFCIGLAERIPYHHPLQLKLVGLLDYLKFSPQLCQIGETRDLKEDKPTGYFARNTRFAESMLDNNGSGPDLDVPGQYVNFQCFAAHLAEHRITSAQPTWAIWALRDAFEEAPKGGEGSQKQLESDELVLGAAQWILWFGQGLFQQILYSEPVDPEELTNALRPGKFYPGEGGLSLSRWRFWKDKFAAIAGGGGEEKGGYGEECVKVSARAAEIMETLEETMTFDTD